MTEGLKNLWAGLQILYSNFNARFSTAVRLLLALLVLALLAWALLRALRPGGETTAVPRPFGPTGPMTR